jgi:hypothetical protein
MQLQDLIDQQAAKLENPNLPKGAKEAIKLNLIRLQNIQETHSHEIYTLKKIIEKQRGELDQLKYDKQRVEGIAMLSITPTELNMQLRQLDLAQIIDMIKIKYDIPDDCDIDILRLAKQNPELETKPDISNYINQLRQKVENFNTQNPEHSIHI